MNELILKSNISHKVDILLSSSNFEAICEIINNGYQLSKKQFVTYTEIVDKVIVDKNKYLLTKIMKLNADISSEQLVRILDFIFETSVNEYGQIYSNSYLNDRSKYIINFMNGKVLFTSHFGPNIELDFNNPDEYDKLPNNSSYLEQAHLLKYLRHYVLKDDFQDYLYSKALKYSSSFFTPNYAISFLESQHFLFLTKTFIKSKGLNNLSQFLQKIKKFNATYQKKYLLNKDKSHYFESNAYPNYNEFVKYIEILFNHLFINVATEAIQESKLLSITSKTKNINISNIDLKSVEFPVNISEQINTLKDIYTKISLHDNIPQSITAIIEDRLPNILNQYINMLPEYRTTMKNHQGKNSEDLLYESLNEINQILVKELVVLQQNNLKELSVSSRILKAKNN